MCGPSSAMKQLNQSIQAFSSKVTDEAGTIFGEANSVFNDIKNVMSGIVKGGPSQAGMGAAELSARNAAAVNAGGAEARNLRGAAASAVGAIGGGNVVTPAGATQDIVMSANQRAAADTAAAENQIQQENYERGNKNWQFATQAELQAPKVLETADAANKTAMEGQKQSMTSQQTMDTASNWWQPLLEKGVMAGVSAFTGGIGGGLASKALGTVAKSGASDFLPSDSGGWGDTGSSRG
jgi:hypothetical protein